MTDGSTDNAGTNLVPPLSDINLYATDVAFMEAVAREGAASAARAYNAFGLTAGSAEALALAEEANRSLPRLESHDRNGDRRDCVHYHPAYHELMRLSVAEGLNASVWAHLAPGAAVDRPGSHVVRAGSLYLAAQMEAGHCCPLTMTHAAIPVIAAQGHLAPDWLPLLLSRSYDERFLPPAEKTSVTIGMGMTERQGGTDVRANTTRAVPAADGLYAIDGHKWFLSAPMSDAFLVLAQAPGGLSCFLMPRFLPDGRVNGLHFQRLKDKLGNRSNASAEVEFHDARGFLAGEEGAGVTTIIEMVTHCRLDCAVSSAALMRSALAHAIHHAEHRHVGGRALIGEPVMQHVLADMALDVEAAVALVFRLARSFDRARDPRAAAWRRLMTPVTKYWVCKMAPPLVAEAMECLGGNGYIETWPLARIYREVPVNSIWEGSGNVMALDVLRVLQREPDVVEMVTEELRGACAADPALMAAYQRLESLLHEPRMLDQRARMLVEQLARLSAATILRAHAPAPIADAYIASRIAGEPRQTYGQGLDKADLAGIIARATPNRT